MWSRKPQSHVPSSKRSSASVSPTPNPASHTKDRDTMQSDQTSVSLVAQHLYASPLTDLSESELKVTKRQLPNVYAVLLQFEKLLRQTSASLEAKDQELRRCIDVGQEVLQQLDLVRVRCSELAAGKDDLEIELSEAKRLLEAKGAHLPSQHQQHTPSRGDLSNRNDASPSSPPPALPPSVNQRELQELHVEAVRSREAARVALARCEEAEEQRKRTEEVAVNLEQRLLDAQRETAVLTGELRVKNSRIEELFRLLNRPVDAEKQRSISSGAHTGYLANEQFKSTGTKEVRTASSGNVDGLRSVSHNSQSLEHAYGTAHEAIIAENTHLRHELEIMRAEVSMLRSSSVRAEDHMEEIRILKKKLATSVPAASQGEPLTVRERSPQGWELERASLVAQNEALLSELRRAPRREVSVASSTLDDLQHDRDRQAHVHAALKKRAGVLEDVTVPELQAQLKRALQTTDKLATENSILTANISQKDATYLDVEGQLRQQRSVNERLQDAIESLRVEHHRLQRANADMKEELAAAVEQGTLHQLKRQEVERERDALEGALKSLRFETQQIQMELANVSAGDESAAKQMQDRLESLTEENERVRRQLDAQVQEVESYVDRVYQCETTIKNLELELESATERLRDQEEHNVPASMFYELEKDYQSLEKEFREKVSRGEVGDKRLSTAEARVHEYQQRFFLLQHVLTCSPPPHLEALDSLARELRVACRAVPRWYAGLSSVQHNRVVATSAAEAARAPSIPSQSSRPSPVHSSKQIGGIVDSLYVKRSSSASTGSRSASLAQRNEDPASGGNRARDYSVGRVDEDDDEAEDAVAPRSLTRTLSPSQSPVRRGLSMDMEVYLGGGKHTPRRSTSRGAEETRAFGQKLLDFFNFLYAETDGLAQVSRSHWEYILASATAAVTAPPAMAHSQTSTGDGEVAHDETRGASADDSTAKSSASIHSSHAKIPSPVVSPQTHTAPPPFACYLVCGTSAQSDVGCVRSSKSGTSAFKLSEDDPSVLSAVAAYKQLCRSSEHFTAIRSSHGLHSGEAPPAGTSNVFADFLELSYTLWDARCSVSGSQKERDATNAALQQQLHMNQQSQQRTAELEADLEHCQRREALLRQQVLDAQDEVLRSKEDIHRLQTQFERSAERLQEELNERRAIEKTLQLSQAEWEAERRRWKEDLSAASQELRNEREKRKETDLSQQQLTRQLRTEVSTTVDEVRTQLLEEKRAATKQLQSDKEALQMEILQLRKEVRESQAAVQKQTTVLHDVKREFDLSNQNFIALHAEHEEQEQRSRETIGSLQRELSIASAAVHELRKVCRENEQRRLREVDELRNVWRAGAANSDELEYQNGRAGGERDRLKMEVEMLQRTLDAERQTLAAIRAANNVLEKRIAEVEGDREPLRQQLRSILSFS